MTPPDLEALLVAMVLSPATYSRNRFFSLHADPGVRHVRRRASLVRGIVRDVSSGDTATAAEALTIEPTDAGRVALSYRVPTLGLRRTATLDPIEFALVRFAMARAKDRPATGAALPPDDPDRLRIEAALVRLAPSPPPV